MVINTPSSSSNILFMFSYIIFVFYFECTEWAAETALNSQPLVACSNLIGILILVGTSMCLVRCWASGYGPSLRFNSVFTLIPYLQDLICLNMHNESWWMPTSKLFLHGLRKILKHQQSIFLSCFLGRSDFFRKAVFFFECYIVRNPHCWEYVLYRFVCTNTNRRVILITPERKIKFLISCTNIITLK